MREEMSSTNSRVVMAAAAAASMALIAIKTTQYPKFFSLSGAKALVVQTILLLIAYGLVIAWPDRSIGETFRPRYAIRLGLAAAVVQVIHLLTERMIAPPRPWDGWITLGFMLATFLFWAATGFQGRKRRVSFKAACAASVWCAIVTMTIAVLFGILLTWWIAPAPLESMRSWAEFERTGWNDLYAFSIANVLDSAFSHLVAGPVIAFLFGSAGYGAARLMALAPQLHAEPKP